MASTNGNTVSGGSTSAGTAYSWRCVVEIVVASESATQVKYTVRLKYYTRYSIDVYSNGKLSGGASGNWSGSMKSNSNSGKTVTVITEPATVNKGSSSKTFSVSGQIQNTGGFGNGTSKATCKVTVPAIDYSAPNAPSNCAASRVSDSQAKATWTNGSTSTTRPRSSTKVERQTDSGSWTQVASVGSSTANYTDNGISANHRYRYRVRAQGSGGYSGYATSGYIYTTPAAPTAVELVKTSDTQVKVSIQGAAPWADSYKLQRSVDSGAWADAASVTSWPYVDTPGGGMVKYRVAAVKGSLQSAWTESAEIATITPPLAPSVALSPADAVLPVGTPVTVAWTPDHPDGSAQSSAQVEYTVAGSVSTATVTGAATAYALPATALDAPATVSVRVRTKGLDPDWGAWSSPAQLALAYPPSVSISAPGIDGATVSELPLTARWRVDDSTGVAEQQLRLYEDGALVHTAQLSTDARSYEFGDSTYRLDNKTDYSIELTVRGGSTLAVTETRDFSTDFAQPEAPEGLLSIDHGDLSASIEVHAGPSQSDEGNPVEVVGREGVAMSGMTVYGNTRQNLWVNPSGSVGGATVTRNDDGTVTLSGTPATNMYFAYGSKENYVLKPGGTYTLSIDKALPTECTVMATPMKDGAPVAGSISIRGALQSTGALPDDFDYVAYQFYFVENQALSGTYRVMLNEGTEAQPWCPPGIHGVEDLTVVTAGKNLAKMPNGTKSEMAGCINNWDGSVTLYSNGNTANWWAVGEDMSEYIIPGETYTVSVDKLIDGSSDYYSRLYITASDGNETLFSYAVGINALTRTFTMPDYFTSISISFAAYVDHDIPRQTIKLQLERGSAATEHEPPKITQTPIDLQGHALNSLPDGTRDELHVDSSGACSAGKNTRTVVLNGSENWVSSSIAPNSYVMAAGGSSDKLNNCYCESLPVVLESEAKNGAFGLKVGPATTGATDIWIFNTGKTLSDFKSWLSSNPVTVLLDSASDQTVELGSIEMPTYPYDTSYVSIASDIPTTLRVGYPVTSSLTVERQLPDGTRWTVGADLADGEQCIDPLPPLNLDYQYLVTASTEAGAAATTNVDARVDSTAAAFNFGSDASTCELLRLDPSWSRSPSIATELYDFADGGEAGGLPMAYTTDSLSVSGQESATTLDNEQYRRLLAIARKYAVGWVRDQLGGRQYCALAWSFSGSVPYSIVQCSVDMSEIRWREAW